MTLSVTQEEHESVLYTVNYMKKFKKTGPYVDRLHGNVEFNYKLAYLEILLAKLDKEKIRTIERKKTNRVRKRIGLAVKRLHK